MSSPPTNKAPNVALGALNSDQFRPTLGNVKISFGIGQIVYLKTDSDQERYIVTGITLRPGCVVYHLVHGTDESEHYEVEISAERDVVLATTS